MGDEQETKPKVEAPNVINLVVKDTEGEVHFKVKPHTNMQRIMDAYADKKSLDVNQIRFLYDGTRLTGDKTPQGLDMEDGDVIDAVLEQVGGQGAAIAGDVVQAALWHTAASGW